MKVSYMKGLASHHGPESCLDRQKRDGEALTGENTGALKSSENTQICRLTLYNEGESTINHHTCPVVEKTNPYKGLQINNIR